MVSDRNKSLGSQVWFLRLVLVFFDNLIKIDAHISFCIEMTIGKCPLQKGRTKLF